MDVRKGQGPGKIDRAEFSRRYRERFYDPAFDTEKDAIERLEAIAWEAYQDSRKAPLTQPAGPEFFDAKRELSVQWLDARRRLLEAQRIHEAAGTPTRVLLISASARNDRSCPGENAKSFRLVEVAREEWLSGDAGAEVDLLDLSLLGSERGRQIHPCKACVSTAMPLCHWPCSCYPNHSLGQIDDWMNEIYERWVRAHAVIIVTPVYWWGPPAGLKAMMDRLVCADGGNPDPTTTDGKDPAKAKKLELAGWGYPKHLKGRVYGLLVQGDAAGTEGLRRGLTDWLEAMELTSAGPFGALDRYIGYYEPYATSHEALDQDEKLFEEMRNVTRAVHQRTRAVRAGTFAEANEGLRDPRPK